MTSCSYIYIYLALYIYIYKLYITHSASCTSASRVFAPTAGRKTLPVQIAAGADQHVCQWSICTCWWKENTTSARCKGQDQHQGKLERDAAAAHATTTTNQIMTSTGAVGVPDAAINAACVRACRGNMVSFN